MSSVYIRGYNTVANSSRFLTDWMYFCLNQRQERRRTWNIVDLAALASKYQNYAWARCSLGGQQTKNFHTGSYPNHLTTESILLIQPMFIHVGSREILVVSLKKLSAVG